MSHLTLGKGRIEALSDGIFAIAMTLLVLELKVPERSHHMNDAQMVEQLRELLPNFFSYVITFLLAGAFWVLHHLTFHFIRHTDRVLLWLNLAFLMLVSLLPFSAGLLGHLAVHPVSQLFYYGNQFAIALLLTVQWEYARASGMLLPGVDPLDVSKVTWRLRVMLGALMLALIAGAWMPAYTSAALAAGLILGGLVRRLLGRRHARLTSTDRSPLDPQRPSTGSAGPDIGT